MPPQGHAFGKYELLDRLATGGMAEIFRARFRAAAGITKAVVIKKILPHYAGNQAFVRMFLDEAQIVVGLSHGNIAQVFDFGEIDGEYFLAMELVHGQALSKVIRRARERQIPVVPTPFAVFIALEMCKGLHYAHTRTDERGRAMGIVHRDVSPQNVILAYDGQVKLVDFGIAKARTAGRSETEVGALKGKYVYFAPEQARGKELDARTDVFAAGIVLYEMLCGRLPFEGSMMDVLPRVVRCEFPRPRSLNPELTPALERIVLTAMAAEKEDRYQSAQTFQEALAGYLYANAPTFSNSSLVHLLGYLYSDELQAEGKPVPLPRAFLEQVPLWQKPLPGTTQGGSGQVTSAGHPGRKSKSASRSRPSARDVNETRAALSSHGAAGRTSNGYRPPASLLQGRARWLLAAVPLVAAAVAALVVFALGHYGTFALQLTSHPPGAQVRLNGQDAPGTTPLLITGLAANRLHLVEVSAPGMKRWTQAVQPERGATLPLHVTLEAEPAPPDLAPPAPQPPTTARAEPVAAVTPAPAGEPPVLYEARWPVAQVRLSPRHHGFTVAPTRAARVRLDPRKAYNIWTEGSLSLGGMLDVIQPTETFYFLEGNDGLSPNEIYGELAEGRKHARVIRNATALYAFMFDDRGFDNSGAVRVRVQERGSKDITTVLVDGKLNTTWPEERQRFTLRGLDRNALYEVSVTQGRKPAQVREGRNGRLNRVVFLQTMGMLILMNRPTDEYARVLEVGQKYSVGGTDQMIFTFPDDALEDNDGELVIEVTPQIGTGGLTR